MILLRHKKLDPRAVAPAYQTKGAACFDITAVLDEPLVLYPKVLYIVGTGLAFEVPNHMVLEVFIRSSLGFKHGICLANGTGIIDSDYRGELKLALINHGPYNVTLHPGERVAQGKLAIAPQCVLVEVDELSETARGVGGIGSTGRA